MAKTLDIELMKTFVDHHLARVVNDIPIAQADAMDYGRIIGLTTLMAQKQVLELVNDMMVFSESMLQIENELRNKLVTHAARLAQRDNDSLHVLFVAELAQFIERFSAPSIRFFVRPTKGKK